MDCVGEHVLQVQFRAMLDGRSLYPAGGYLDVAPLPIKQLDQRWDQCPGLALEADVMHLA